MPHTIVQEITELLNNTAETGNNPKELKIGYLVPLQKTEKTKGPPENLLPIILLSILRKILSICVIGRISDKVRKHIMPQTQVGIQRR